MNTSEKEQAETSITNANEELFLSIEEGQELAYSEPAERFEDMESFRTAIDAL